MNCAKTAGRINKTIAQMEEDLRRPDLEPIAARFLSLKDELMSGGVKLATYLGGFAGSRRDPGAERRKLWENVWTIAHSGVGRGDLVLEAGGASTLLGFYLAAQGCRVIQIDSAWGGFEPIRAANEAARKRGWSLSSLGGNAAELPGFVKGVFDVCFCISVLEHLRPEKRRLMSRTLGAALRPGGILALSLDWIRRRGPYPQGLCFRERKQLIRDVVHPSGCNVLGNTDWVDDEGDVFCGTLFLRHPDGPDMKSLQDRKHCVDMLAGLGGLAGGK